MLRHSPLPPLVLGSALAIGIAVADPRKDAAADAAAAPPTRSASLLRLDASTPRANGAERAARIVRSERLQP